MVQAALRVSWEENYKLERKSKSDAKGLLIAIGIVGGWFLHLSALLWLPLSTLSPIVILGNVLLQTFLNTGLFITAHDAIHGLVYPANRKVNAWIGRFCAIAYAALPYDTLVENHVLHHRHPRSEKDPDFHTLQTTGETAGFLSWYRHFMGQYWSWEQFISLAAAVALVVGICQISLVNVLLLWGLPLLLSSLQLFYFGTYRPHRIEGESHQPTTCANKSPAFPWLLSLLACYHFSYHQEHHDHPNVPWWGLPALY